MDGAGVARWQLEWGRRVLREHPDFPYREGVKMIVALAQLSLGERDEGLRTLREVAEKDGTMVTSWARVFLAAQTEAQKSRP